MDSEDPHSQASVQRVSDSESQSRIERSVDSPMSSREDSLAVLGSEREPTAATRSVDHSTIDEKVMIEASKAVDDVSSILLTDEPVFAKVVSCKNVAQSDEKARERNRLTKQKMRQVGSQMILGINSDISPSWDIHVWNEGKIKERFDPRDAAVDWIKLDGITCSARVTQTPTSGLIVVTRRHLSCVLIEMWSQHVDVLIFMVDRTALS